MKIIRTWLLYPLLFAVYPVLALLTHNLGEVALVAGLRALLVTLLAALLLWTVLRSVLHSWGRAALICAWVLLLFFAYGHIYAYFETAEGTLRALGRHRLLLPLWVAIVSSGIWLLSRVRRDADWVYPLNVIALVLIGLQIFPMGRFAWQVQVARREQNNPHTISGLSVPTDQIKPDVYYIILDAYARQDELAHTFAWDNDPFLSDLQGLGFVVAPCSQSNYAQTLLSLGSSLNMDYLQTLTPQLLPDNDTRLPLRPMVKHSRVRDLFEQLGYTMVAFETGYRWTEWDDADYYLTPETQSAWSLNNFEIMLIRTTAGLALNDLTMLPWPSLLSPDLDAQKKIHYARIHATLDQLENLPTEIAGPKFVFVHILAPHSPHVLGPSGDLVLYPEKVDDQTYIRAYTDEVAYLNFRLMEIVPKLIADSDSPPIIILQADHGHELASSTTRMWILNTYYFPGVEAPTDAAISPVNSFRWIFDRYFGGEFGLLEDRSYFSYYQSPYDYQFIPNECLP